MMITVMKLFLMIIVAGIILQSFFAIPVNAVVRKKPKTVIKAVVKNPVVVSPVYNKRQNAVLVYFKNLSSTASVSYILSYKTNGKPEGAGGQINTKGKYSLTRKLLLGTCSSGVCRYHRNVTNIQLQVTVSYKNGSTTNNTYSIR